MTGIKFSCWIYYCMLLTNHDPLLLRVISGPYVLIEQF